MEAELIRTSLEAAAPRVRGPSPQPEEPRVSSEALKGAARSSPAAGLSAACHLVYTHRSKDVVMFTPVCDLNL